MGVTEICDRIARSTGTEILKNPTAERLTTFKGGGEAERVYAPRSTERAAEFLSECAARGVNDVFLLGGGSNVILADGELMRPVLLTREMHGIDFVGEDDGCVYLRAECGAGTGALIAKCAEYGCGGAEFLAGVPATVGGAAHMNAGAFGYEIKDYIYEYEVLNPVSGEIEKKKDARTAFSYRRGADGTVLAVTFAFPHMSREEAERGRAEYVAARRRKQPCLPSCGSVFRNADLPAGALIAGAGLKGVRLGGAEISRVHANFIVNVGGASADDFLTLADIAAKRVAEEYGIRLQKEFVTLSDDLPF